MNIRTPFAPHPNPRSAPRPTPAVWALNRTRASGAQTVRFRPGGRGAQASLPRTKNRRQVIGRALDALQHFLSGGAWVLKLDIRKYFYTVDHAVLFGDVRQITTDSRLLELLRSLLQTYDAGPEFYFPVPGDDLLTRSGRAGCRSATSPASCSPTRT